MILRIEKAVYGGAGLAHQTKGPGAGSAVFVPFTLPDELVDARFSEHQAGSHEAALLQVLEPSKHRVAPGCIHFGECGGCHYQHAEYTSQVQIKTSILQETLERAGLSDLPEIQPHTAHLWGYRNRTRLRIAEIDGVLHVGYNRRASNNFLPIRECPITAPLLWRAAEATQLIATEKSPAARWIRGVVEVEFFTTVDETKLQMTIFLRKDQPGLTAFSERMKELIPELTGAGTLLLSHSAATRRSQKPRPLSSWGADGLTYHAANEGYWVSRGGFFQVNRFLVDELVEIATANHQGSLAWDLYAGVGLFSRALAKNFQQVVAVEAAGDDLTKSFKGPGKRAIPATTVEFLRQSVVQRERPELILMDPPRAGVGAEVCTLLGRIEAPTLVYVSCDPVTLARDLRSLVDAGYRLTQLHMIDLFPQTFHLETIVVLSNN
jgi:23S rRNA (uracil1939-C5)-methyltransferase